MQLQAMQNYALGRAGRPAEIASSKHSRQRWKTLWLTIVIAGACAADAGAKSITSNSSSASPVVITVSVAKASDIADVVHHLYPHLSVRINRSANAVIVVATPDDANAIRAIVMALDVKNPQTPQADIMHLMTVPADQAAKKLRVLFPRAKFTTIGTRTLIANAPPGDLAQIKALVTTLDESPPRPTAPPEMPSEAFHISQAQPPSVARAVARALPKLRVSVSGSSIVVQGPSEDVAQVKALLEQIDRPRADQPYVSVYRLQNIDAGSVAALLSRSFPSLSFAVTKEINAISVSANGPQHARIADALAQLDAPPTNAGSSTSAFSAPNNADFEVLALHAAIPSAGGNGGASTTPADIAQTVTQTLTGMAPDLKITVQPNSTRLVITGSARSRELARKLITLLDVADPLVELDTRVLEIDEGAQTQLGLKFPTAALTTSYSEIIPPATSTGTQNFLNLQGLTRTPLTLGAELDFLIANNEAKILEDPRITTFSGRTATLRAGETVNILTTAGGGTGTVATTQIQSFQTGVTLDITPVVNADNYVTVTLHPSVNSIAGIGTSGVPNIQTRDTTTTIGLHDGETLIIGGLIEDTDTKTVQKIPLLGDLPLIGRLFQDTGTSHTRNELVVTVTPHILKPGDVGSVTRLQLAPSPLPTVGVNATLPPKRAASNAPPEPASVTDVATQAPQVVASATPQPSPSASVLPGAFNQTNTYTFGSAPQNNYADVNQPPRIFFIRAQPTVVKNGVPVTISVLTTTNVVSVTLGPTNSMQPIRLTRIARGKWQATIPFDASLLPSNVGNVNETLTAASSQDITTTENIPFTIPAN